VNVLRLASASPIRRHMLECAGVPVTATPARVDEDAVRAAMTAEGARPRDIADALAELKARRVGLAHPRDLVLGADQVLDLDGRCLSKAETPDEARAILGELSAKPHVLWSAAVVWQGDRPIWRHVGQARMKMRPLSPGYIDAYVARNWPAISGSVGCYQIEAEGIRLFETIGTDYHSILGLPLVQLLSWLVARGDLEA